MVEGGGAGGRGGGSFLISIDGDGGVGRGGIFGGDGFLGSDFSLRMVVMENSLSGEWTNEKLGLKISIEEMQRSLNAQYVGIDAIKSTVRTVFGASSLIVALMAALQLSNVSVEQRFLNLYHLGIGAAMILYVALILLCIYVLLPILTSGPVEENWNVLYDSFTGKSKIDIQRTHLAAYLNAIERNEPTLKILRMLSIVATSLLPVIVVILLLLNLIPRGA